MKYFVYCRKSSEAEDRQILSIDSQKREVEKAFAGRDGIRVIEVLEESKSAKAPGRPIFDSMIRRIEKGEAEGIIAWHPDRLARNSVDGGRIIYLLDTGSLKDLRFASFTFENSPQGKFMLSIIFANSKYYVDALSQNVRRGNRTKVENGWLPNMPPMGYLNDRNTGTIVIDEERFPLLRRMWEMLLSGGYAPARILEIATSEWGLRTRKTKRLGGGPLSRSAMYRIFTNQFYAGVIEWEGRTYTGKHRAMITLDEFDRAQAILGRIGKPRRKRHRFAFTGMIRCGECGMRVTAEQHVKRDGSPATYYRCTKKRRNYRCAQPYIEGDRLEEQVARFLARISIPGRTAAIALRRLEAESEADSAALAAQRRAQEQTLVSLEKERENLIALRLRDLISDEEFKSRRADHDRQILAMRQLLDSGGAKRLESMKLFFQVSEILPVLFESPDFDQKRLILQTVGSNVILRDGQLRISAAKPFKEWHSPSDSSSLRAGWDDVRIFFTQKDSAYLLSAMKMMLLGASTNLGSTENKSDEGLAA